MILQRNSPARPLALPDRQVLVKGLGALDRRGVTPDHLVDVVRGPVRGHGALVGAGRPGVVGPVRLDHVELHQWGGRPAVQREQAVARRGDGARVVDGAGGGCAYALY